jgi:hypothetical protein
MALLVGNDLQVRVPLLMAQLALGTAVTLTARLRSCRN